MQTKALWAGIGAGALWGFSVIAPRLVWNFSSWDVAAARYLVYGIVSAIHLCFHLKTRKIWLTWPVIRTSFVYSLVANTIYYTLLVYCARRSGVPLTSLMVGLLPVTVALFGRAGQIRLSNLAGPLTLLALGIFVLQWQEIANLGHWDWFGFALLVFEIVIWTWYAVANAKFMKRHPKLSGSVWSSLSGVTTLTSMAIAWFIQHNYFENSIHAPGGGFQPASFPFFVLVAIISGFGGSWLAFGWWNYASQKLTTALTGQLMIFETLFALVYTWFLDFRLPTSFEVIAIVLFLVGVRWSIRLLSQAKIAV